MPFKLNELPPAALLNQRGWGSLLRSWYHYSNSSAHENANNKVQSFFPTHKHRYENKRSKEIEVVEDNGR